MWEYTDINTGVNGLQKKQLHDLADGFSVVDHILLNLFIKWFRESILVIEGSDLVINNKDIYFVFDHFNLVYMYDTKFYFFSSLVVLSFEIWKYILQNMNAGCPWNYVSVVLIWHTNEWIDHMHIGSYILYI